ncbi:MAG: hypothetical protein HYV62_13810 [Candidatus Rokubacteria bacterium]|nr:hypothetical protein [Candidatus Rokubacteria bacterium]
MLHDLGLGADGLLLQRVREALEPGPDPGGVDPREGAPGAVSDVGQLAT